MSRLPERDPVVWLFIYRAVLNRPSECGSIKAYELCPLNRSRTPSNGPTCEVLMRLFVLPLALMGALTASAGTIAFTGGGLFTLSDSRAFTTGWGFSTSGLTVTALGYFDDGQDGLLNAHDVGIFAADGTLLVSATVPQGVAGTLNADWRFVEITPFTLDAGSYVIGGFSNGYDPIVVAGAASASPEITLGSLSWYTFGGSLSFPTSTGNVYLNPNFEFDRVVTPATATPEPSTFALGVAIGLVALRLRR